MPLNAFPIFERPSAIATVENSPIMGSLSAKSRSDIARHSFMAYAERDETIWTLGSPSAFVGIVACGSVRLVQQEASMQGETIRAGGVFGLEAICGRTTHQAHAIAAENTWYLKVPAFVFLALSDKGSGHSS